MAQDTLIEVDHLVRYYGDLCAVNDVSFAVNRGEVLGFLGPNGAGKTTTMQILSGTLAPSAGRVTVGGLDMLEEPKHAKAQIGYLPEHPPLYRDLTVEEYLWYCARLHRVPRKEIRASLARAKRRCGLEQAGKRLIGNLSKGYQQRLGIAQAILHSPAIVILDEPTVGLDPLQIREIRALIRELGADHSVILSTHILPEVQAVCDRVLIIHQGSLVLNDSLSNLTRRQKGTCLHVALKRPPVIESLAAIEGVGQVEPLDENRFRIHYRPEADPAEAIAERAVSERWGLYELAPETHSLEETFVQLTCGDCSAGLTANKAAMA
jgi:ABC-2 type transport system ATP-binding protein